MAELDERAAAQHAPTVQSVTLASLHSAKGLEWDVVFLVGVADGKIPITYADTDEQIEEERRLLYVGITRARERLHFSWALARSPGNRPSRRPSPFLGGLRPGSSPIDVHASAGRAGSIERGFRPTAEVAPWSGRRAPARCRVCGRALGSAGEMKLMTLVAIAETEPATPLELSRIPGILRRKLDRYGDEILAICAGQDPGGGLASD